MSEPASSTVLSTRLLRVRQRARRVLLAERLWPALRLPLLILSLYVLASLIRLPQSLPDAGRIIVLGLLLAAIIVLALRGFRRIEDPTRPEVDRRIERASHASFQPLLTLEDRAAWHGSNALWQTHAQRVVASLPRLRAGWPRPSITQRESWTAIGLMAAITVSVLLAGTHAPSRLAAGFIPGRDDADVPQPQIQAWIDMPDYAPGAPVFLNGRHGHADVPQGAILTATITGTNGRPTFSSARIAAPRNRQLDARSWTVKAVLEKSGPLLLRARGRDIAHWDLTVQPDLPPEVSWNGNPSKEDDGWAVRLPWKVSQSHGVASLEAEIRLKSGQPSKVLRIPITLDGKPKDATGTETVDLSNNPWAGETVTAVLHAVSVSGADGRSKSVTFKLPERTFHDPIAKALIALRKRLALGHENRITASDELRSLAEVMPHHETGATLGLLLSASALRDGAADQAVSHAIGMTWVIALYLEDLRHADRETALANLDLHAAQTAVQEQLDHMRRMGTAGHSEKEQEELARRMKTMREALDRRMQTLMKEAMRNGAMMPDMGDAQNDADDAFSRLMKRLQSDAAGGHGDDALKRLQKLEELTERMRNATPEDLENLAKQMKAQREAAEQRRALHDLVRHETRLLDHAQSRLSAQKKADTDTGDEEGDDLSTMSTAELLRRLGIRPPAGIGGSAAPAQPATAPDPSALDPQTRAAQSAQRRTDHALQRSLQHAGTALNDDAKTLVGKKLEGLSKAEKDMVTARKSIAAANDQKTQSDEVQVLKDLAEAGKQMKKEQKGKSKGRGRLALLPSLGGGGKMQKGSHSQQGQAGAGEDDQGGSDDEAKDRDPLGRKLGEGDSSVDSDSHIPESNQRERAREIERELRKRDSDRTRPQSELDYLDRLLRSY